MVSAAILAGGQARRFGGADKGRLAVGGRTILERQLDALTGVADTVLLVGYRGDAPVPAHVRCVPDEVPDRGPLGGLATAFSAAPGATILLLACDMPFLHAPFLSHLLELAGDADAVVPRTERGYHPLCAAYTPACEPVVRRQLQRGALRMLDLLPDVRLRVVGEDAIATFGNAAALLANVNTAADLDALGSLLNH